MRVSIVNCVSTAADMMRFSDRSLFAGAGHGDFDYVVVKWLASPEVEDYLRDLPGIAAEYHPDATVHVVEYMTNPAVGYVPNLRAMMNAGFNRGFELNEYAGLVNTDCYFGSGWLSGLVRYAGSSKVINSFHITAATPPKPVVGILTCDLGPPLPGRFNVDKFRRIEAEHYDPTHVVTADEAGGDHRQCATMPYLFHRDYWNACGPWELTLDRGVPDVRFFNRVHAAGATFAMTKASIIYHHEAVERRGRRPAGAEYLKEE